MKKNQEKHCWTFLKPFFQLFPWYITIYTTVTYCREGGSLFQIFFHIPNCSSYFTIFFQSNNQKQMPLELEFLTIEQDCFTKCEVSFLQILLFHLRNPILEKNWPSFSFKAFGYARVLALQSTKKVQFWKVLKARKESFFWNFFKWNCPERPNDFNFWGNRLMHAITCSYNFYCNIILCF